MYAAQEIPQIDTEIAQKGHFRMETKYALTKNSQNAKTLQSVTHKERQSLHVNSFVPSTVTAVHSVRPLKQFELFSLFYWVKRFKLLYI